MCVCVCVCAYACVRYHAKFWGGWRRRSFSRLRIRKFLQVVIPMTIGNCVEDWGYQILAYLSGSLGPTDVAAISIMFNTWGILWAFYWGWGLALQGASSRYPSIRLCVCPASVRPSVRLSTTVYPSVCACVA